MSQVLETLLRLNLVTGAAILVILALRPLTGRLFGARVRYALWLLAPAAAMASLIPARVRMVEAPVSSPVVEAISAPVVLLPGQPVAPPLDWQPWLVAAWIMGATVMIILMFRRQAAFVAQTRNGGGGPAVVGFLRPRIHTPDDFETRFDAEERGLILAHERTHLRRHDARINGVVGVAACLNWFNPLIHLAARLSRLDQELSCDEYVANVFPHARHAYAQAMLKTQLASHPLPLGCYWPARGIHPLEQRIAMLKAACPGRARRRAGATAVAFAIMAAGAAAWAAQPPRIRTTPAAYAGPQAASLPAPAEKPHGEAPAKPTGDICLTNSCASTAMLRDQTAIDAALKIGDPVAVMAAGGDPEQILAAMVRSAPAEKMGRGILTYLGDRSDGSILSLENVGGVPRINRYGADGQLQMSAIGTAEGFKEFSAPPGRAVRWDTETGEFSTLPAPVSEPDKPLGRVEPPPAGAALVQAAYREQAPDPYVVQEADWIRKPTFDQMLSYTRLSDLRRKVEGEVLLRCRVQTSGSVNDCAVVSESNPAAGLGKSVLRTTRWFRIKPPEVDGAPVDNTTVLIPFRFNLRQI